MANRLDRFGEDAILVTDEHATGYQLLASLPELAGVIDAIPGAHSLLLQFRDWSAALAAIPAIRQAVANPAASDAGPAVAHRKVQVPVRYLGADLADVARLCGMSEAAVIQRHLNSDFTVAFCGFAPGFAYLTGLDPALHVPRLPSPRPSVAAGSVAIADAYGGIYPRSSPGGWRLLGHTDVVLFDPQRNEPALLTPGTGVHFVLDEP